MKLTNLLTYKLTNLIKVLLYLTAFTFFIITPFSSYPFVFGKVVFFRSLVEIALILFLIYLIISINPLKSLPCRQAGVLISVLKNPLFIFLVLFIFSATLSTLFAPNFYKGIWGDAERGEGLIGFLHYFIFLGLALVIFENKDWLRFFKISLIVGFILIIAAWLQYFGATAFFEILGPAIQPGSFIGNPAFLAAYLILLLGFAAIVYYQHKSAEISINQRPNIIYFSSEFWKYFSVVFAILAVATIFITSIRGAIVGLGVGVLALLIYFAIHPIRPARDLARASTPIRLLRRPVFNGAKLRLLAIFTLILIIVFGFVFWFTRENKFWQPIPGLGRLASTTLESTTVITRLLAIGISFEAFKEKPIFGWGLDNYHVAYNKHFNPRYSIYAEEWFDRAHNKILDVLVMQGIFGLLAYLGIFISAFYLLFRKPRIYPDDKQINVDNLSVSISRNPHESAVNKSISINQSNPYKSTFIAAAMIAYFVQNLFVLDGIYTYIPFFALLGFLINQSVVAPTEAALRTSFVKRIISRKPAFIVVTIVIITVIGYLFYLHNLLPLYQNLVYRKAVKTQAMEEVLAKADKFLYPYTFIQSALRLRFADLLNEKIIKDPEFRPLVDKTMFALEELIEKEPMEPRFSIRLAELFEDLGKFVPAGEKFLEKAEKHSRQALLLSPKRQAISYHLSFILSARGKHEEAIGVARQALDLEPKVVKSHYHLAIALAIAADAPENKGTPVQEAYRKEAKEKLNAAYELGSRNGFANFLDSDLKNMLIIYNGLGDFDKFAGVLEILITRHPRNQDYRYDAINVYQILQNKEGVIKHAKKLKELDPSLEDKINEIIDRAEREEWGLLSSL